MPESRPDVVDPNLADYIAAHSTRPDDTQRALMRVTEERTGAAQVMQIGGDQGTFMEMLVRAMGARLVVEVGTATREELVDDLGPPRLIVLDSGATKACRRITSRVGSCKTRLIKSNGTMRGIRWARS